MYKFKVNLIYKNNFFNKLPFEIFSKPSILKFEKPYLMMKKRILFSLFFFLCAFFFRQEIANFCVKKSLAYYVSHRWSGSLSYTHLEKSDKGWTLKDVDIQTKDRLNLKIGSLQIRPYFDLSNFELFVHLEMDTLQASLDKLNLKAFKQSPKIHVSVSIENGELSVGSDSYCFRCKQEAFSKERVIELIEKEKTYLSIKKNLSGQIECRFDEFNIAHLERFQMLFFHKSFQKGLGKISGTGFFDLNDKSFSYDVVGKEIEMVFFHPSFRVQAKQIQLKGKYPAAIDHFSNKSYLKIVQNMHLLAQIENGSFGSNRQTYLEKISAKLSYSPKMGPKWDIKAVGVMNHNLFPLQVKGRGFFHPIFSSWIEAEIKPKTKASNISCKFKNIENQAFDIECIFKQVDDLYIGCLQKVLSIFPLNIPAIDLNKGWISGSCTGRWDLSESILSNMKHLSGNCTIKDGSIVYLDPKYTVDNVQANIEMINGWIHPSSISFQSRQIQGFMYFQGELENPLVQVKGKGPVQPLLDLFPWLKKNLLSNSSLSFQTSFTLKKQGFFGTFQLEGKNRQRLDAFTFGFTLKDYLDISHGWIKGKDVGLDKYNGPFKGVANAFATFEDRKVQVLVSGKELEGSVYGTRFKLHQLGREDKELFDAHLCARIQYHLNSKELSFEVPLQKETAYLNAYDLQFEEISGKLLYKDRILKVDVERTISNQVRFSGTIAFETNNRHLQVLTKHAEGTIASLSQILSKLSISSSILDKLSGRFISGENGLYITTIIKDPKTPIQFKVSANVYDGSFYLSPKQSLQKLQARILINQFEDMVLLDNVQAKLFVQSKNNQQVCDLYIPYIQKKQKCYLFDIRLSKPFWDISRLVGTSYKEGSLYRVCLDNEKTHFLGDKLNIEELIMKNLFQVSSLRMNPIIDLDSFMSQSVFFAELLFHEVASDFMKPYQSLQGKLNCKVQYGLNQDSSVEIFGNDLKVHQKKISKVLVKAVQKEKDWDVYKIVIGSTKAKCRMSYEGGKLSVKNFTANMPDIGFFQMHCKIQKSFQINGKIDSLDLKADLLNKVFQQDFGLQGNIQAQGRFSIDLPYKHQKWQIESDLDIKTSTLLSKEFAIQNIDPLQIYFSLQDGLVIKGLNLHLFRPDDQLTWMSCKIGKLYHQTKEQKYLFSDLQLYLPKENIKELLSKQHWIPSIQEKTILDCTHDWEICANGSLDVEQLKCFLDIDEYHLHLQEQTYFLKDLHLVLQPNKLQGECRIKHLLQLIPMGFVVSVKDMIDGKIYFKEKKDPPLTIHWIYDQTMQIQSIEGNFHGLNASFHRQTCDPDAPFMGSLKVDLKQASDLVPPLLAQFFTELQMGQGYEFMGKLELFPFSFDGIFSGRDCVFAGYMFKTLLSSVHMKQDRVQIKDFKMSDKSGIFKIDQVDIKKTPENRWLFSIPNIHIKEFRPSLLQKKDQELKPIKPLVVRDLNIYNLHGDLEDKNSYLGTGDLTFVNSFKRGHTLLDLPADVLGRIFGLDMELLIPAKGSLDFAIHDKKFFIHSLKEVYSEGKRSKFFLVEEKGLHTLDFDGNLNVYIQMKHFVLFKFTEPFILSIEGSLKEPNFSLKTKKSFFSSKEKIKKIDLSEQVR